MNSKNFISIGEAANRFYEKITNSYNLNNSENNLHSLEFSVTDFTQFYNIFNGFNESGLYFLLGSPAMGKTTFSLDLALNQAIKQKTPVYIFSYEMNTESTVQRLINKLTYITPKHFREKSLTEQEKVILEICVNALQNVPIFICDNFKICSDNIEKILKNENTENALIIIDYFQLFCMSRSCCSKDTIIHDFYTLKRLAHDNNLRILCNSQLMPIKDDNMPELSDADYENNADAVIFIFRKDCYSDAAYKIDNQKTDIIVAKNSYGETGMYEFLFQKSKEKFT